MHTTPDRYLGRLSSGECLPLTAADRRRHTYVVGKTGTGKSVFLLNLMHADLLSGAGFAFLDPHGDAAVRIASLAPRERRDVLYLDPSDPDYAFAFNPLAQISEDDRALAAANIASAFKNIWADSWGPRLEYIFINALRLLLDASDQTLLGIPCLLADDRYRDWLVRRCRDPVVKKFWLNEFAGYESRQRAEAISPIQNKVGAFLTNPFTRAVLCQTSSTLDFARAMNEGRVLIFNLGKGRLGEQPAHLIGALLVSAFAQAAEARADIDEDERRDFTLYVDEFQAYATDSFATILSETRKWRLAIVAAHQYLGQLPDNLRDAVFGNVGSTIVFRVGGQDARILARELDMANPAALADVSPHHAWARIVHNGMPIEPKLIATFPPPPDGFRFPQVRKHTRAFHTIPRAVVDRRIEVWIEDAWSKPPVRKKRGVRNADQQFSTDAKRGLKSRARRPRKVD